MSKFKVGDKVVLKKAQEAYYSGYASNPVVILPVGAVGIVGSVDVPCCYYIKGQPQKFNCVDFVLPGVFAGNPIHGNCTWRCGVFENEMKLLR